MSKRKMTGTQPKLKLHYFDLVGKGEPIRLLCAYAGLELEDCRFSIDEFNKMKQAGKFPFGQVPLLEVDDNGQLDELVQSSAILRYLGRLSGLYPFDDLIVAAKIDAILAQEADAFIGPTVVTYKQRFGIVLDDVATQKSKEMIGKEVAPRHLLLVEKLLETSSTGWLAGTEEPSPADFVWYVRFAFWMQERPDLFPDHLCKLEDYPHIKAFKERFENLESIKSYYAAKKSK